MNKRLLGLMVIIFGLIIILLIVYFLFFYDFSPGPNQPSGSGKGNVETPIGTNGQTSTQNQESKTIKIGINANKQGSKMTDTDLKRMAGSFAERFGSYSNQAGFANIYDLYVFMTPEMQKWSRDYVEEMKKKKMDLSIYYGITTMAVTTEMKNFDDEKGSAEVLVKTQRREAVGTQTNSKSFYQDITIIFAKDQGVWKVDKAFWKE